jgi:hypothetical protein
MHREPDQRRLTLTDVGGYAIAGQSVRLPKHSPLFKIVHDHLLAGALEDAFDEFDVQRMDLVVVLGFLVRKDDVQRDLVRLVNDRTMAGGHLPDMEMQGAGNSFEIVVNAGNKFVSRAGIAGVSPENDDV